MPILGGIQILSKKTFKIIPVFLYALGEQALSNENKDELRNLKDTYPYNPVLFVSALAHISFDSIDSAELTKSEQRRLQTKAWSEASSTIEDSLRSTSTQNDSIRSSSTRLNSVKEHDDEGLYLDKISSLGLTWLDQLTDLGFIGESVDIDHSTWLDGQNTQSSDLLDSCKKLGKYYD